MTLKLHETKKMMRLIQKISAVMAAGSTLTAPALAQTDAQTGGSGTLTLSTAGASTSGTAEATSSSGGDAVPAGSELPYLDRYIAEPNLWELGIFGGIMFPSSSHELLDSGRTQQPFETAGEIGVRFAYYPLAYVGAELELAAMPSELDDGSAGGLFAGRGHVIGQLPISSITPFALLGAGALGGTSSSMGTDVDPAIHFGIGAKAALDEYLSLRLDVRDTLSQKFGASNGSQTHHPEVLLGLTFTLERTRPDSDGDGFADHRDECPNEPGDNQGCPLPDQDNDGFPDESDECPEDKGVAPHGCPDGDGDGIPDAKDTCPAQAATTPTGCPVPECPPAPPAAPIVKDTDGDGINDTADRCPQKPETNNGFQDSDGCPDELPEAVKRFSGVIKGIEFDYDSANIRPTSTDLLDEAAAVLKEYPDLRLEISGHTDSEGDREHNMDLSRRRAESVKTYLVGKGVEATRLVTRGAGPDEPIADNKTIAGRQQNRRIEFKPISARPKE